MSDSEGAYDSAVSEEENEVTQYTREVVSTEDMYGPSIPEKHV
jgi:hypothetical protein